MDDPNSQSNQREQEPDSPRPSPLATPDPFSIPLITGSMLAPEKETDHRIDFERGMSYFPRLTLLIILACVVVFLFELRAGAMADRESIIRAGALHRASVFRGEVWRLFTAMFLHGSTGHLVGNCIVLYIVGMAMEHAVGWRRMARLYLASGLVGGVLSLSFNSAPSVGASGAIFGVLGGIVAYLYKNRAHYQVRDKRIGFVFVLWAVWTIGFGFLAPFVDNYAHIGGLAAGVAMGLYFPVDPKQLARIRSGHL